MTTRTAILMLIAVCAITLAGCSDRLMDRTLGPFKLAGVEYTPSLFTPQTILISDDGSRFLVDGIRSTPAIGTTVVLEEWHTPAVHWEIITFDSEDDCQ